MGKVASVARRAAGGKTDRFQRPDDASNKRVRRKAVGRGRDAERLRERRGDRETKRVGRGANPQRTKAPNTLALTAAKTQLKLSLTVMQRAFDAGNADEALAEMAKSHYLLGFLDALTGGLKEGPAVIRKLEAGLGTISQAAPRSRGEKSLRELQANLPWTIHYHRDFRASPMAHKDFAHALLHVHKAAGKLAALVNDAEHAGCEFKPEQTDAYVADLVVCALRMANTCPGRVIDLQRAVIDRIEKKNDVKLP